MGATPPAMIGRGARLRDGRYTLERLLGRGGMASVWLARDAVLERQVAVKLLSDAIASDPDYLARFRREARVAGGLSHPNLVGIFDFAEGGERPYLVMEYVAGGDLEERLSGGEPIRVERLARELLGAVAHMHAAGVLHRDIKPHNLLTAPDGAAKLTDFGIALPAGATTLTRTGHVLGTARYVAPEVMSGEPASERSDLYSCGVVLGECLAPGSPPRLRALVGRLRAENPERRPRSAADALSWLAESTTIAQPLPARPGVRAGIPVDLRKWGAAVLAAALAVTLAIILLDGSGDENPGGTSGDGRGGGARAEDPRGGPGQHGEARLAVPLPRGDSPELGAALNDQGYELIQQRRYEEAIPVLENAIKSFPRGTDDLDYAYALFNLGNALRLAGRPEAAIPVLERRLRIPNQTTEVRAELAAARRAAGASPP